MAEEKKLVKQPCNLILEDRRMLTVSGVEDIDRFDEEMIVLITQLGELKISGSDLHLKQFQLETGEVQVEGEIDSMEYEREMGNRGGMLSRLFR